MCAREIAREIARERERECVGKLMDEEAFDEPSLRIELVIPMRELIVSPVDHVLCGKYIVYRE